jgi:hypothetical protein
VLQAAQWPLAPAAAGAARPSVVVAGATGALGSEVLLRLIGGQAYALVNVLAREAITPGLRGVALQVVPAATSAPKDPDDVDRAFDHWPLTPAEVGIVMFEAARDHHERERALWTPRPEDLPALARWMQRGGVTTLALVLPHAQGRLPEALKRGLAGMDEYAVAALGFERLVIVRSARKPEALPAGASLLQKAAAFMLSVFKYMVPNSEQPVRAIKVAELVECALASAPPGIHIAAPELVWQAAQGDLDGVVARWLHRLPASHTSAARPVPTATPTPATAPSPLP